MSIRLTDIAVSLQRKVRLQARKIGFDVHRFSPQRRRETLGEAFEHLAWTGITPRTVIDVGVARGTPELYKAFPTSALLLVEPLEEWKDDLIRLTPKTDQSFELAAASSHNGVTRIRVPERLSHSSFYQKDRSGLDEGWTEREIRTKRLDDIVSEHGFAGPYVLKVDVEGAELEVLRGAPETLKETQAVALEVTFFEVFAGGATFAEVVAFMANHGFAAYDFVGGFCRESDFALYQLDVVFTRTDMLCQ